MPDADDGLGSGGGGERKGGQTLVLPGEGDDYPLDVGRERGGVNHDGLHVVARLLEGGHSAEHRRLERRPAGGYLRAVPAVAPAYRRDCRER